MDGGMSLLLQVNEVQDLAQRVHVLVAEDVLHVAREDDVVLFLGHGLQPAHRTPSAGSVRCWGAREGEGGGGACARAWRGRAETRMGAWSAHLLYARLNLLSPRRA